MLDALSPLARRLLVIGLCLIAMWFYSSTRPLHVPDGIVVAEAPIVQPVGGEPPVFEHRGHRLTASDRFSGKVRVVAVKTYAIDRGSQVSPLDAGVAWGRLSDSAVLRAIDLAQSGRELVYHAYDPKLGDAEVAASLLNLHVVPSTSEVEAGLSALRAGQIVTLSGYLVVVAGADGWRWRGTAAEPQRSAASRVLWVESLLTERAGGG